MYHKGLALNKFIYNIFKNSKKVFGYLRLGHLPDACEIWSGERKGVGDAIQINLWVFAGDVFMA